MIKRRSGIFFQTLQCLWMKKEIRKRRWCSNNNTPQSSSLTDINSYRRISRNKTNNTRGKINFDFCYIYTKHKRNIKHRPVITRNWRYSELIQKSTSHNCRRFKYGTRCNSQEIQKTNQKAQSNHRNHKQYSWKKINRPHNRNRSTNIK